MGYNGGYLGMGGEAHKERPQSQIRTKRICVKGQTVDGSVLAESTVK